MAPSAGGRGTACLLLGLWLAMSGCAAPRQAAPVTPTIAPTVAVTIGMVSANPREITEITLPFADEVARRLEPNQPARGQVIVAGTPAEMAELLRNGKADLYVDSPFPALAAADQSGGVPFLRRWKRNQPTYHSVIFARVDSGINKLRDLEGKIIALQDPDSTSAFMLPRILLREAGLRVVASDSSEEIMAPDRVGYVLSGEDENTVTWVLRGKVQAGGTDLASLETYAGDQLSSLRVLERSPDVPRHIVVHRPGLSTERVRAITEVLATLDQDDVGRSTLAQFEKTSKFDTLTPEGIETVRSLQRLAAVIN